MIVPFVFLDVLEDAVCRGPAELVGVLEIVLEEAVDGGKVAELAAIVTVCVSFGWKGLPKSMLKPALQQLSELPVA